MASKKDDEDIQARQEAEIAQLQNDFLRMPRIARELTDPEELPISPAIVIDESAGPLKPAKSLHKPQGQSVEPLTKPLESTKPRTQPKQDFSATESLLAGMLMPTSRVEKKNESPPEESSSTPEKSQNIEQPTSSSDSGEESVEKKTMGTEQPSPQVTSSPQAPELATPSTSTQSSMPPPIQAPLIDIPSDIEKVDEPTAPSFEKTSDVAASPTIETATDGIAENSSPSNPEPNLQAQKPTMSDESPSKEKSGMFSKAKSLFSNITKKDKKE